MELVETAVFTRQAEAAFSPDEYRAFQLHIILRPDAGDIIPGSGGLRKLRWHGSGRGKRGGIRIIYYWKSMTNRLFLLYMYPKNVRATLSPVQLRELRKLVGDE
jgi:mRNA-degrading endonuclease RelE of RelBE toxin-antitoxin system